MEYKILASNKTRQEGNENNEKRREIRGNNECNVKRETKGNKQRSFTAYLECR
jgi:hypothetical protein